MRKKTGNNINQEIEKETVFGILPVTTEQKKYGFLDALLILGGYCIATWSYTQGSYLATLVGFRQLLIGAFFGAILMLVIYQLPVILSVRYGIDIWIWLKAVFGKNGIKIVTVLIIVINFPWYAVCSDLFASSMINLFSVFGIELPDIMHPVLGIICVFAGTFIALKGVTAITWATRILVPLLIFVGGVVIYVGFSSVPGDVIMNYVPENTGYSNSTIPYILSIEANFAFVITLVGGMAEIPRLTRTERAGLWSGVLGQGLIGSSFVVIGAVMAIATEYVTGEMINDPTVMLAVLSTPAVALSALLLVGFANIGTQAVGSYIYGVMLKSAFPKLKYQVFLGILAAYIGLLVLWGRVVDYFGSFLTIGACIYAPLAALLFCDFFIIRKQRIDLRSAFELKGHNAYEYSKGFNAAGFISLTAGILISLAIYNPLSGTINCMPLFYLTPTGCAFLGTGILYVILCKIPPIGKYMLKDRNSCKVTKPFDTRMIPPKQNLFFMPLAWLICFIKTRGTGLSVTRENMDGLKPPYIVLGTHQSFTDFYVTPLVLFPHRANYVSELEGFEAYGEWLYRQIGCLGTRKFVTDINLVKNIKRCMDRKGILVLYPEARYANIGTSSKLPPSIGKLLKFLKVPVVSLNMHGNYLQSPIWNLKKRKDARLQAQITQILTPSDIASKSADEINEIVAEALTYDEYAWQEANGITLNNNDRAKGLHLPLYKCPICGVDFKMYSERNYLFCKACGTKWEKNEWSRMIITECSDQKAASEFRFSRIPDWYEWEREEVKKEIDKVEYRLSAQVKIEALPNAVNFIDCGEGRLIHDMEGFYLRFKDYGDTEEKELFFSSKSLFSIHTEYNYRGKKGQCITLSTQDNTYFLYPLSEGFNATRIQFAAEYIYELSSRK